ncbi:protein phosphatase CheZ [Massilia eurypsychrophila]|jgi:chemotaxis protein CheZ|uniref:Protein phosphatase CheZ n=1 Tax=Massilia eurypsychrophila TaxID=1485217 RepID=A0A2G8THQ4_9BURK|nr:protein phosphatase CheZ [Massilia eurypsychrophila]PIL45581.1 protein phosphatase CheZ [Massilia eurypsychrophila]
MGEIIVGGATATGSPVDHADEFLSRIGHMTRALHDSLRGLGLDKLIEKAASDIPDARDRLDYVARLSEQAAQKVLNATDAASPLQDKIDSDAQQLSAAWNGLLEAPGTTDAQWRALAESTILRLDATRGATVDTKAYLMDIMMAQDFQDLTGQVITKVTAIAQNLEQQLVQMLVDFAPPEVKREFDNGLLNGPQINPTGNSDVVSNQGQVDDLLDSLGF